MTLSDISDLLALCANYDGRTVSEDTPAAWLLLLEDIPAEDAADAVRTWYRTDRRWIMPADIVTHHQMLAANRAIESARLNPPGCWGCGAVYELGQVPGTLFALTTGHEPGCRAVQGVLRFDEQTGRWGVLAMDGREIAVFDEALWMEAIRRPVITRPELDLDPSYDGD